MFKLSVQLQPEICEKVLRPSSNELIKFIKSMCQKYICKVNDYYNLEVENDIDFCLDCKVDNNVVNCDINCNSYDTTLKIIQCFFRCDIIEFKSYKFHVTALQMEELIFEEGNKNIIEFASA